MSDSSYTDLAQRIEESFAEIEDEAIADFKKTDEPYAALYQQISKLKEDNPFIGKVMDGSGDISLSAEEHETRRHGTPAVIFQRTYRLYFVSEKGRGIKLNISA